MASKTETVVGHFLIWAVLGQKMLTV